MCAGCCIFHCPLYSLGTKLKLLFVDISRKEANAQLRVDAKMTEMDRNPHFLWCQVFRDLIDLVPGH